MITFSCTGCAKELRVKDEFVGQPATCPHCKKRVTVPGVASGGKRSALIVEEPGPKAPVAHAPGSPSRAPALSQMETKTSGPNPLVATVEVKPVFDFLGPAEAPDELGRLGGYRILKLLGQGGMGMVFKAEDVHIQRPIALKVMKPDVAKNPSARERFLREARACGALKHDNIISIYQVGEDRHVPFIAMEFLQGGPLDSWLKKNQASLPQALKVGREIASGLAAAHARGLIHRDIKPANIWLEAPKGRVKILDFGLARSGKEESKLTQTGAILGTPAYMSPEQARADRVDARTDLFSLGCILYELCAGQRPFQAESITALLMMVASAEPKPPQEVNPEVPPAVAELIMKLLAKKAEDRPQSAKAVVEAIQVIERAKESAAKTSPVEKTIAADPNVEGHAESVSDRRKMPEPVRAPSGRLRSRLALLALVLGAVGLLTWGALRLFSNEGTLVVETDDPEVNLMVKQGGKFIVNIDPKINPQIKLPAGAYQIALADESKGLRLSAKQFDLKRGDRKVVKVSLPATAGKKPEEKPRPETPVKSKVEPKPEPKLPPLAKVDTKPEIEAPVEPKLPPVAKVETPKSPLKNLLAQLEQELQRLEAQFKSVTEEYEKARRLGAAISRQDLERIKHTKDSLSGQILSLQSQLAELRLKCGTGKTITNSIGMKLVEIPAGEFMMGSPEGQGEAHERPRHQVRITQPFYLGVHEVTQEQYRTIMGKNPSQFKGSPDLPVEMVSWEEAKEFCQRLSDRPEEKQAGIVYRLPTEAQWEYACRAGSDQPYSFGVDAKELDRYGWYDKNSGRKTQPVGKKEPNAFGLHDMHGNVYEWCADCYDGGYYKDSPREDPENTKAASNRVFRGGSWYFVGGYCRSAYRLWNAPDSRYDSLGFRVAAVQSR